MRLVRLPVLALCASLLIMTSAFTLQSSPSSAAALTRRPSSSLTTANRFGVSSPNSRPQKQENKALFLSSSDENQQSQLPMLLDPGTKGGALFLSLVLFVVPILGYQFIVNVFHVDGLEAGKWIGVGFTAISLIVWVSSYIFRVATKDMTYAKQLKDYENAVIAKRLEELDEDEVQALVEDIERDSF